MADAGRAGVTVIVNGTARQNGAADSLEQLQQACGSHGLAADVVHVDDGAQIEAATRRALDQGARMVVAGGGDGTVSAVASHLVDTGVILGVLPMGTLNHFAKDLGIPIDLDAAVAVIAQGRQIDVDVGEVNGRIFINNSSLGLYPEIVRDREQQRRRLGRGKWRALAAASMHALQRYPVLAVQIEADGRMLERRSAFVFIGNNEYQMEGFSIGERSGLTDGRLSLYVTQRTGRFGLFRLALRALLGRLQQASDFDMLTAATLVVNPRQRHIRVATDGEVQLMQSPLAYRIRPGALRVIVPAGEQ